MKYTICSGWWCDGTGRHIGANYNKSSDFTRSIGFFELWYMAVKRFSQPESIIITDSHSLILPNYKDKPDVQLVSLRENFGHGMVATTNWGGWTRAFFNGIFFAMMNGSDYAVFIEQDCLIIGEGIIEEAIESMGAKKILCGTSREMGIEQSLTIVKTSYIPELINRFFQLPPDRIVFTETKFQQLMDENWSILPFGVGRDRPIDWGQKFIYVQHLTEEELDGAIERII